MTKQKYVGEFIAEELNKKLETINKKYEKTCLVDIDLYVDYRPKYGFTAYIGIISRLYGMPEDIGYLVNFDGTLEGMWAAMIEHGKKFGRNSVYGWLENDVDNLIRKN